MNTTAKQSKKAKNKEIGTLGEYIAAAYLERSGYTIVARNYAKKWGEIDIVARENDKIHFIEVKTVSHETKELLEYAVTRETWRPEELVHAFKLRQISRMVRTWIQERNWDGAVQLDVVAVRMVPCEKFAVVNYIENIVI